MQVCDLRWYSWRYEMSLSQSVVVASPTLAGCRKEESVVGCVETGVFITAVWDISQLHDNGNGGWARGGGGYNGEQSTGRPDSCRLPFYKNFRTVNHRVSVYTHTFSQTAAPVLRTKVKARKFGRRFTTVPLKHHMAVMASLCGNDPSSTNYFKLLTRPLSKRVYGLPRGSTC